MPIYTLDNVEDSISSLPYLEATDRKMKLVEEHNYFYQVQLQMLCTDTKFADFFIWSPRVEEGIFHIERISRSAVVCETIIRRSCSFFFQSIIPELLGKYYSIAEQRKKEQRQLQDASRYFKM